MTIELIAVFITLGLFVGFMAGLLGIGGGGILVPILTTIFVYMKVPSEHLVHLALGTSMGCIVITSLSSLQAHHKHGGVIWEKVKIMTPGVILGTFSATFLASHISSKPLAVFFSIFMGYISIQMLLNIQPKNSNLPASNLELMAVSSVIGAFSALVSIGGGSLTVPYLNWRNIDIKKAIGTSAALGFPIAISGSIGYLVNGLSAETHLPHSLGFVYLPAVMLITVPSYFTTSLGARLAHHMPVKILKQIFGLLLIVLSIKMLLLIYLN